jgi:hypothetical protein
MKLKFPAAIAIAALIAGALVAPAGVANAKKKKAKAGPVVVGTDPAGDWGSATDPTIAPLGDVLGQDLVEARIEPGEQGILNFVIQMNSLPPSGGAPEVSRYVWDFMVGDEFTELDGKFTNYSRGACDPTAGSCPPPRDPGLQPFLVRGNCTIANDTGTTLTTCEEIGIIQASFDAAKGTITIPVPLELIGAKPGTKITGGANIFGGSVSASPAAFVSSTAMPLDTLTVAGTYTVPKK